LTGPPPLPTPRKGFDSSGSPSALRAVDRLDTHDRNPSILKRTETRMHLRHAILLAVALTPAVVHAQESYKIEALKQAPPEALSGAIRGVLEAQGYRIVDDQGKSYAEFWLRKATPAQGKPTGPKGAILFPVLREGELLGALRFAGEASGAAVNIRMAGWLVPADSALPASSFLRGSAAIDVSLAAGSKRA